jgi:hypothetical protein
VSAFDTIVSRLEHVQASGDGCRARCPSCGGKSRKLSVTPAPEGRVLLHCFGSCTPAQVLAAIGLELGDLFDRPAPLAGATPEVRARRRREATVAEWRAAQDVLCAEAAIVAAAGAMLAGGEGLDSAALQRLSVAVARIDDCALVLAPDRRERARDGRA